MQKHSHINLLLNRQSTPHLTTPSPNADDLAHILQSAMAVPDHGNLTPWRMTVAENEGLDKLSKIFVNAAQINGVDEEKLIKTKKMPYRAPMIIIVSTEYKQHPKVPHSEQLITAGCAVHAMQMAAYTLGYGAMWRTGDLAVNEHVKAALNISLTDDIVGFLYIGTIDKVLPQKNRKTYEDITRWLA